jgi:hypothetical protein
MPVAVLRVNGLNFTARQILTCFAWVQSMVLTVPEAAFAGANVKTVAAENTNAIKYLFSIRIFSVLIDFKPKNTTKY